MALSTYADLKSAIADWLERSDLSARIPDFIMLAESRLNRLFRGRMNEVNAVLATVPGTRALALPASFSEAISVHLDGCPEGLRFVDPVLIAVRTDPGRPVHWTVEAGNLAFERPSDQVYAVRLRYMRKFTLSDVEPSNPLLAEYPDLYLFGALLEAAPFLRDADLLALFQVRFGAALQEANGKEKQNRSLARLRSDPSLTALGRHDVRAN